MTNPLDLLMRLLSAVVPAAAKGPHAASLLLRTGLAFTFGYAAIAAFVSPDAWVSYIPGFLGGIIDPKLALDLISVAQLVLALWLLTGVYISFAALISIGFLAGIVVSNPATFLITFRDVALVFASLALISLDLQDTSRKAKK